MEKNECKKLKCAVCGQLFGEKSNLKAHILLKHKEVNENDLMKLMMNVKPETVQLEQKPFTCDICSKQFVRKANLRNHMEIHIGKEKVECIHCGLPMDEKNVKRHQKSHQGERLESNSLSDTVGKGQITVQKTPLEKRKPKQKPRFASLKTTPTSDAKQKGRKERQCEKENKQTDQFPLQFEENDQQIFDDESSTMFPMPHSDECVLDSKNCRSVIGGKSQRIQTIENAVYMTFSH